MDDDTIAALSTPPGRGGIAVIRVSGEGTQTVIRKIVADLPATIIPQKAYHRFIVDKKKKVDECVVLFFKAPFSYSGEDLAELSIHSNPFLVEAILKLIYRAGVREALPGEFTYRAFRHGKIDLIQAESVNELIDANSSYYAAMKFGSLEGGLSRRVKKIREHIVRLGIKIETRIEFEEDQGFEGITLAEELDKAEKDLQKILENSRFNEVFNKGFDVVIAGKVNVGKSSLFNTLLMQERSIISALPGTTRDFIKEKLHIDGLPVEITDVAGINRETKDEIEAQGIERSLRKIENCDAVIFMLDASCELDKTDFEIFKLVEKKRKIVTANKIDIAKPSVLQSIKSCFNDEKILEISVTGNINIDKVRDFLKTLVGTIKGKDLELTVNQRQKTCLLKLLDVLRRITHMVKTGAENVEIVAEEIREAMKIIGELTGEITPDDILQQIFSQFCVGK
jgi:tRNA modification GTPase